MRMQSMTLGVLAFASLVGCATGSLIDMSGANYVGRGDARVDIRLGDASAMFDKDARPDAIRINELGRSGAWTLDFNDVAVTAGGKPAKAYVTIEFRSKPTVGTMRARVTTEIFAPDRINGERVRESSETADVVFDKVDLVMDGAVAGRIALSDGDMVVRGSFDLRLGDTPALFTVH